MSALPAAVPLHVHGGGPVGPPPGFPVLTTTALYLVVLLAGALAAPAVTSVVARTRVRDSVVGVVGVGYAGLSVALAVRGEIKALTAAAVVTATAIGLIALARGQAREQLFAAAVLIVAQVPVVHGDGGGPARWAFTMVHLVAAALWVGAVAHLALVGSQLGRARLGAAVRSFTPYAVGSAVTLAGTGVALLLAHHVSVGDLRTSVYGNVVVAKSVGLTLAALAGLRMRRGATSPRRVHWLRGEALTLTSVVALAAVLEGLPLPAAAVTTAAPGLATVRIGHTQVVPLALVAVDGRHATLLYGGPAKAAPTIVDRLANARGWRPAAPGDVTTVDLAHGRAALTVRARGRSVDVSLSAAPPVDLALGGAADRAAFALGRALAAAENDATANQNEWCAVVPTVGDEGAAYAQALRRLHIDRVDAVGAATPRSRRLLAAIGSLVRVDRAAQPESSGQHGAPVVVATEPGAALRTVRVLAHAGAARGGVFLAPWLLDGRVLTSATAAGLPVTVAAAVDPMSPIADDYRVLLTSVAPALRPSAAGLEGFLTVADPEETTHPELDVFAATQIGFLPKVLDTGHDHSDAAGWFPNGTLVPITHAVPMPARCTTTHT
jgi:putative copper export protein